MPGQWALGFCTFKFNFKSCQCLIMMAGGSVWSSAHAAAHGAGPGQHQHAIIVGLELGATEWLRFWGAPGGLGALGL